jgi:hypothetical protein
MNNEFSPIGFIKAIPAMTRRVWPGFWPLIVIITLFLYFDDPTHLNVLAFSDWAAMHILIVVGMISTTIWLYNTYKRPVVNTAVIGLWLLASAFCMLADFILQSGS